MNQQRVLVETKPHNQQNQQNQINQPIQNKEYETPLQHYNINQTSLDSLIKPASSNSLQSNQILAQGSSHSSQPLPIIPLVAPIKNVSFELPLKNYNAVLELGKLENEANKVIQKENETKYEKGIKI